MPCIRYCGYSELGPNTTFFISIKIGLDFLLATIREMEATNGASSPSENLKVGNGPPAYSKIY